MSKTPAQTLRDLSQLSLSPLKLDSSLSSISSLNDNPPPPANLTHSSFAMSSATTSTRPGQPLPPSLNGRPNPNVIPQKRPAANLFIPKKKPRPNASISQPHSANNTPKPVPKALPNASQLNSTAHSSQSNAKSPGSSMDVKLTGPPKGVNQAPIPIDAPYTDFDLLTGDINGPIAPGGFYAQMDWNIFKFHRIPGNKSIIDAFEFPIKLNRKNFKYLETGMDVDEDESPFPTGEASTSGAVVSGGLLDGLDLADLKNVIVPGSASQIGTPGTSTPQIKAEPGTSQKKGEKLVQLKGPDGQPVIGPDGQPIMVTPAVAQQAKGGRMPFIPGIMGDGKGKKGAAGKSGKGGGAAGGGGKPGDGKGGEGRKRGGKKTRQVFMIPEETRKLKKEERYPWLWEDKDGKEIWEGRRIEKNKVKMQLLQVCKDGTFRWYPARKQYMFTKLPTWRVPNAEEANERFERDQKRKNPTYFAENTDSAGFRRAFRQHARQIEMEDRKGSGFSGEIAVNGDGRSLRIVDRGRAANAFERDDADDGDEEVKRELQREKQERDQEIFGMEGDLDEMEYDEEMADDDEKVHADGQEEEEKEYEERLKREWFQANKTDVEIADHTFMGRKTHLGKQGKKIKKMLRGQNKDADLYGSDSEDKDPYASEEESDSEEDVEEKERLEKEKMEKEKAEKAKKEEEEEKAKQLLEEKEKEAAEKDKKGKGPANAIKEANKNGSATGGKNSANASRGGSPKPGKSGDKNSRAGSPAIRSTSTTNSGAGSTVGAGNALTAMRATSPGSSKARTPSGLNINPATGRMSTPLGSGSTTPVGNGPIKRKADTQSSGQTKKQKTDSPNSSAEVQPAPAVMKKKKIEPFPGCLTQDMVVNYLREREEKGLKTQTKDAIARFKHMWDGASSSGAGAKEGVDIRNKELLIHWIKKVADLTEGNWLSLRKGY